MQNLNVIETRGVRALTSAQIADCYGTTVDCIKQNFCANKARYKEGKHYIALTGNELRDFKNKVRNSHQVNMETKNEVRKSNPAADKAKHQFETEFKYAKSLYLWTEKGALLHAKSLNTDKAWEVYDYLVDFYFRAKETASAVQEQKPSGRLVVDVPENPEIQKRLSVVRKYMNAVDTILDEYNTYHCEENHKHYYMVLNNLAVTLTGKILDLLEAKPNMVRKHY